MTTESLLIADCERIQLLAEQATLRTELDIAHRQTTELRIEVAHLRQLNHEQAKLLARVRGERDQLCQQLQSVGSELQLLRDRVNASQEPRSA